MENDEVTEKHAGGRPTKYTPELIAQTKFYLENYETIGDEFPSISGLSVHLHISRSTIHEWRNDKDKQEFSDTFEKILSKQENILWNKGITGAFVPAITKLALGNHGYSDKQATEFSGSVKVTKIERTIVDPTDTDSAGTEAHAEAEPV